MQSTPQNLTPEQMRIAIDEEAKLIIQAQIQNLNENENLLNLIHDLAVSTSRLNIYLGLIKQQDAFADWLRQIYPLAEFESIEIKLQIPNGDNDETNTANT